LRDISLDGNIIVDKASFYKEIESKLAARHDILVDEKIDSLIDVLSEITKEQEPVHITWENYSNSKENMSESFLGVVVEIFGMFERKELSLDFN